MSGATLPVLYSYNMAALVAVAGFRVKLDTQLRVCWIAHTGKRAMRGVAGSEGKQRRRVRQGKTCGMT